MKSAITILTLGALAAPAHSGGFVAATAPVEQHTLNVPTQEANWTANYVGAILGYGTTNRQSAAGEDSREGFTGSLLIGHMRDFGQWVGAVEVTAAPGQNAEVGGLELKWAVAARVKGGFKFGADSRWLGFATIGAGRGKVESGGTGASRYTNGYLYGAGVEYLLNDRFSVGAELTRLEKTGDGDADATGVGLTAAYRF